MEVHGFEKLRFSLSLFVNTGETCVSDRSYFEEKKTAFFHIDWISSYHLFTLVAKE